MRNLIFLLIELFCLISCSSRQGNKSPSTSQEFFNINFEDILYNKRHVNLSQLASNVEYIMLETNDNCLLRPIVEYYFTDSLIFVSNKDHILKFSRDGKFLKKIGSYGRGPGEIDFIRIISVIPEKKVIAVQVSSKRELLYFNFDGDLVKTVRYPSSYYNIKLLNDERYLVYEHGVVGDEIYSFVLANKNWDTLTTVENYTKWIHNFTGYNSITYPDFKPFYSTQEQFYIKAMYNDTVYRVEFDNIKPSYFLNLGKFKLPKELRPERLGGREQLQKFIEHSDEYFFTTVFEASNEVFVKALSYGGSHKKYILFDRQTKEGILLIDENGYSTGFINDYDGGIDFWPSGCINDNQVYMPIDAMNFKIALKENEYKKKSIKFPDKQIQLNKMVSDLEILTNPILIVVTLNKDKWLYL